MPKRIDVPGYGEVEFPDEMSDEQIAVAIQQLVGESATAGDNRSRRQVADLSRAPGFPLIPGGAVVDPARTRRFLRGAARGVGRNIGALGQLAMKLPGVQGIVPGADLMGGADAAITRALEALPEAEGWEGTTGEAVGLLAPSVALGPMGVVGEAALNAVQAQAEGGSPVVGAVLGAGLSRMPGLAGPITRYLRGSSKRLLERGVLGGGGKEAIKDLFEKRAAEIAQQRWLRGSHAEQRALARTKTREAGETVGRVLERHRGAIVSDPSYDRMLTDLDAIIKSRKIEGVDFDPRYAKELTTIRDRIFRMGHQQLEDGRWIRSPVLVEDLYDLMRGTVVPGSTRRVGGLDQLVYPKTSQSVKQKVRGWAAEQARHIVNREFVRDRPDLEEANKAFSLMADLRRITFETARRKTGQSRTIGKIQSLATGGLAGTLVGGTVGGPGGAAIGGAGGLATVLTMAGMEFLQSPQYALVASSLKRRLADHLAAGRVDQARRVLARMMAQVGSQIGVREGAQ